MSDWPRTHAAHRADLEKRGYIEISEAPVLDGGTARVGDRVRNRGEQYPRAYAHGTARIVAIYERPDSPWSRKYRTRDIEIITQRDREPEGECGITWANYGTALAKQADAEEATAPAPDEGRLR